MTNLPNEQPIDLEGLREAAEKATPGPWEVENPFEPDLAIVEAGKQTYEWAGRFIAHIPHFEPGEWERGHLTSTKIHANAAFIALANPQTVLALLARLEEAERAKDRALTDVWISDQQMTDFAVRAESAESSLAAAQVRIEELKEGLKPFAEHAEVYEADLGDEQQDWPTFTIGDFRRARSLLSKDREPNVS